MVRVGLGHFTAEQLIRSARLIQTALPSPPTNTQMQPLYSCIRSSLFVDGPLHHPDLFPTQPIQLIRQRFDLPILHHAPSVNRCCPCMWRRPRTIFRQFCASTLPFPRFLIHLASLRPGAFALSLFTTIYAQALSTLRPFRVFRVPFVWFVFRLLHL